MESGDVDRLGSAVSAESPVNCAQRVLQRVALLPHPIQRFGERGVSGEIDQFQRIGFEIVQKLTLRKMLEVGA